MNRRAYRRSLNPLFLDVGLGPFGHAKRGYQQISGIASKKKKNRIKNTK
jgi:hypothetical protein